MHLARINRTTSPSAYNDHFFAPYHGAGRGTHKAHCWTPPVDIFEADDALTFQFEVPGVKKEAITLELKDGILTVTGEKPTREKDENQPTWYTRERCTGKFSRSFRLSDSYDPTSVQAKYEDGILTVTLAKREEAKPVTVEVQ